MTSVPKAGNSLDDFRQKHDKSFIVPTKIKEALKKLGNAWMYESDFIRMAGLSQSDFANFREPFVDDHALVVERTKRVWCGSKAMTEKLREMVP